MLDEAGKDHIARQIAALFEGLDVADVANIMTVQLAMLVAQSASGADDAVQFLDEIRDEVEAIVRTIPDGDFPGAPANGAATN